MREFNQIDIIDGLNTDKSVIVATIQDNYAAMVVAFKHLIHQGQIKKR